MGQNIGYFQWDSFFRILYVIQEFFGELMWRCGSSIHLNKRNKKCSEYFSSVMSD